jgi:hypothetical protein
VLAALTSVLITGCSGGQGLTSPPDSASCGTCHPTQYAAWSESAHARSGRSDAFIERLPEVEATLGSDAVARCIGCHQPDHAPEHTIAYVSCHGSVGNIETRDRLLRVDLTVRLAGVLPGVGNTEAHGTLASTWLRSSELCGTCHEVTGPGPFVEPTFSEFQTSPAAAAGKVCVDCHDPHRLRIDEAFVAAAVTSTLVEGRLTVVNTGAGHSIPTGATFARDVWIEVAGVRVMTLEPPLAAGQARSALVPRKGDGLFREGDVAVRYARVAP